MNTKRPVVLVVALVLMALLSLGNLPAPLLPGSDQIPNVVLVGGIVLGVVGLAAAVGLWMLQRWAVILTIVISVLNALSALPGTVFAPNLLLQISAVVEVIFSIVIIVLVLLPSARQAYAPTRLRGQPE